MPKRIAITPGEPAGIGPDIIVTLAQQSWPAELVVFADRQLLLDRAAQLGLSLTLREYAEHQAPVPQAAGTLTISHVPLQAPVTPGLLEEANGHYVVATLTAASQANLDGQLDAIVTGPVHKGIINQAGIAFSGHTEFFAHHAGCSDVVMMLATEGLRVALVTTHIPLSSVPKAITRERLIKVIDILHHDLKQKFG